MVVRRIEKASSKYNSEPLSRMLLDNFYGKGKPLQYKYVRDLTSSGRFSSRDYKLEPLNGVQGK